jgi:DNA relaxase NicK
VVQGRFVSFVDCGIDYLTATCTDKREGKTLERLAHRWLSEEASYGNEVKEWSAHGYAGIGAGAVNFGRRWDSLLVRITGHAAKAKALEVVQLATNVSRIDYQSTVLLRSVEHRLAEAIERQAKRYKMDHGLKHAIRLLRDDVTGNTLYMNRRVSDRFIRVYDKGAESKLEELRGCWRGEIQYNNELAWSMARQGCSVAFDDNYVASQVYAELEKKGVRWLSPMYTPIPKVADVPGTRQTTSSRQLKWLRSQVSPTIRRLIANGFEREILDALGLRGPYEGS